MVGERLREARVAQGLSLAEVAGRANVSAATLSRIERDKQAIDVGIFLILAQVLHTPPADLLGGSGGDGDGTLVARIAAMQSRERTRFWQQLCEEQREQRKRKRADARTVAMEVEELLAQMDLMREQMESVSERLTKKR